MKKVAVVYWSGTGNTKTMADSVMAGVKDAGGEAVLYTASAFSPEKIDDYDGIAFGCPSMGAEVLEEDEFDPMFESCKPKLSGKPIALFGSYGWGDGEWMRIWEEDCKSLGAILSCDFVIANETPNDEDAAACKKLGASLV